ncbi:hypothetical protein [Actinoplanes teichomyceticus]|uniref:Alpha/beta hydrolase family protein n=1 Tax=Actinoplanes teichomyceticus TaxID=1867 RepID=A0A561WJW9_ACTTI|nr:hypothetical protein [Actinoplanes teichomyceticus]TWG24162.1 hypothetical protein FHX34_102715 [Actinoplanes teichomyceticus]GIF12994.1 hypothetical protein Ate01nite_30260 [Actinoplanes teichomyceticus]
MTTLAGMTVPGNDPLRGRSAFSVLHPGLYRYLDIPDVASLAAPRPMYLAGGAGDPLLPPAGVQAAYAELRAVRASQHAGRRLRTRVWPGPEHVLAPPMRDAAFDWRDARSRERSVSRAAGRSAQVQTATE